MFDPYAVHLFCPLLRVGSFAFRQQMACSVGEPISYSVLSFACAVSKRCCDYWQKQTTLGLRRTAGSIKSQQTFLPQKNLAVDVCGFFFFFFFFFCLHPRPAEGNHLPHTQRHTQAHTHSEGIWAARQLRVIEARSICSGVTHITVNNTILTPAAPSIHHFSYPL